MYSIPRIGEKMERASSKPWSGSLLQVGRKLYETADFSREVIEGKSGTAKRFLKVKIIKFGKLSII